MFRPRLVPLLLALITLVIYLPAGRYGFSLFDDSDYVTQNRMVQNGLTWAGLRWAFTTFHASNWHPLTWLSHMLDCQLFGLNPGPQHLVNVLLHTANVALVFTLFRRLTQALWPAAFVAALFAWHPLHVESVAWIAERKDVLSTLFELLALLAYAQAVADSATAQGRSNLQRSPAYWLALLGFGLALLAKPMVVTVPFILLLLDYWPLQRTARESAFRLVLEKLPFLLLAAGSCVVTFIAQHRGGMVVSLEEMPLDYRLANVPIAYWRYLAKAFWPEHLAIFYPRPAGFGAPEVLLAIAGLLAVTGLVWIVRKGHPWALVGWLWYLGTLVPVIGLVQVGEAAMSDRYAYVPLLGIFLGLSFEAADLSRRWRIPQAALAGSAALILVACMTLTARQLPNWHDDIALFSHAVQVTTDNEPAHLDLGLALDAADRHGEALDEYRVGLRLNPHRIKTYDYLADGLANAGQTNEALANLQHALALSPRDEPTHRRLAHLLAAAGRTNEALAEFQTALELNPADAPSLDNFGLYLTSLGRCDDALARFKQAAQIDPGDWRPPYLSALALLKEQRDAEAVAYLRQAIQASPDDLQLLIFTAQVLASDEDSQARDGQTALALATHANALADGEPEALAALAMALAELGRFGDAQKAMQTAMQIRSASGATNDVAQWQQRLALYQNNQPCRQTFAGAADLEAIKP
jgi:tetratricopeptide (TPR) repeat protein